MACLDLLALLVSRDPRDHWDLLDQLAQMVSRDPLDRKDRKDCLAPLAQLDRMELEPQELLVSLVWLDRPDPSDQRAQ